MKSLFILFAALWIGAAQSFPTKPVKIIVAFPPGGGTDIVARLVGARLADAWGQPVVIENRAGASGTIGTEIAARAEPDGHTLFMATMGNMTANQHLYAKMAVDPLRAFSPITKVVDVHFVLMANPSLPANNVRELIELAKKRPGEIPYSSSGPGGAPHLAMELFSAHPLQGQLAEHQRPDRRARHGDDGQPGAVVSAHQVRQAQGARGAFAQAHRAASRRADRRRDAAGLCAHQLVRPARARGDTEGHRLKNIYRYE